MHTYSIDNNKRETVTMIIVVLSFIIIILLTPKISEVKDFIYGKLLTDQSTAEVWRRVIESLMAFIPSISSYGILNWTYNTLLWKCFKWWHHVPDFSGNWKMELNSEMKASKREIDVTIKQNWKKISIETVSCEGKTIAISNAAMIEVEKEKVYLKYAYRIDNNAEFQSYDGFNILHFEPEHEELSGSYFSAKTFRESELRELFAMDQMTCINKLTYGVGSKGKMHLTRKSN